MEVRVDAARSPSLPRLTRGDRGPEVARLQALLSAAGYETGVSGDFDNETAGAVREFKERAWALLPTKYVGGAAGAPDGSRMTTRDRRGPAWLGNRRPAQRNDLGSPTF